MNLYEVTNSFIGESYVRVYVWCINEDEARRMATEMFKDRAAKNTDAYWTDLKVEFLFSRTDTPFATRASDSGFERM